MVLFLLGSHFSFKNGHADCQPPLVFGRHSRPTKERLSTHECPLACVVAEDDSSQHVNTRLRGPHLKSRDSVEYIISCVSSKTSSESGKKFGVDGLSRAFLVGSRR